MKEPLDNIIIYSKKENFILLKNSLSDVNSCTKAKNIDIEISDETSLEIELSCEKKEIKRLVK